MENQHLIVQTMEFPAGIEGLTATVSGVDSICLGYVLSKNCFPPIPAFSSGAYQEKTWEARLLIEVVFRTIKLGKNQTEKCRISVSKPNLSGDSRDLIYTIHQLTNIKEVSYGNRFTALEDKKLSDDHKNFLEKFQIYRFIFSTQIPLEADRIGILDELINYYFDHHEEQERDMTDAEIAGLDKGEIVYLLNLISQTISEIWKMGWIDEEFYVNKREDAMKAVKEQIINNYYEIDEKGGAVTPKTFSVCVNVAVPK